MAIPNHMPAAFEFHEATTMPLPTEEHLYKHTRMMDDGLNHEIWWDSKMDLSSHRQNDFPWARYCHDCPPKGWDHQALEAQQEDCTTIAIDCSSCCTGPLPLRLLGSSVNPAAIGDSTQIHTTIMFSSSQPPLSSQYSLLELADSTHPVSASARLQQILGVTDDLDNIILELPQVLQLFDDGMELLGSLKPCWGWGNRSLFPTGSRRSSGFCPVQMRTHSLSKQVGVVQVHGRRRHRPQWYSILVHRTTEKTLKHSMSFDLELFLLD
jgi:hypothetical protein